MLVERCRRCPVNYIHVKLNIWAVPGDADGIRSSFSAHADASCPSAGGAADIRFTFFCGDACS